MNVSYFTKFNAIVLAVLITLLASCQAHDTTESSLGDTEQTIIVPVADCSKSTMPASGIYFAFNSAELYASAHPLLNQTAAWLFGKCSASIRLEGRTDRRGSREENKLLGQKRADVVRSYLVSLGVNESRIETISLGEDDPVCDEDDPYNSDRIPMCQAQNNSVDMILR